MKTLEQFQQDATDALVYAKAKADAEAAWTAYWAAVKIADAKLAKAKAEVARAKADAEAAWTAYWAAVKIGDAKLAKAKATAEDAKAKARRDEEDYKS